jgi:hypothetical protein
MKFRDAWLGMPRTQRERLAAACGTSYRYLQKLSGGFGVPSVEFAHRLSVAMKELTGEELDIGGFVEAKMEAGRRAAKS